MTQIQLILPWGRHDSLGDLSRLFLPYFIWFSDSAHTFETPGGLIPFLTHVIFKLVKLHWFQQSFSFLSCSKCEKNLLATALLSWFPKITFFFFLNLSKAGNITDLIQLLYYFSKNLSPIMYSRGKKCFVWGKKLNKESFKLPTTLNFSLQCIYIKVQR